MNGEGGEIPTCTAATRCWRGQQVASGRFGVTGEMLNSSYLVEIKIGQGAKPGEGGHLPAKKVTEKVAQARNATAGTDLISPSNNHDLYSIEDLAELIDELKTANPDAARVGEGAGGAEHRHDRRWASPRPGADMITLSGLRGRHRRRARARPAPRGPAGGHRHARRAPGADGGGHPQPRGDLGRRRPAPRPRHREAALPGRQPGGLRHAGDGLARLHDLPRLPARHLPRGHRDPDRVREEAELKGLKKFTPAGARGGRRRTAPASSTAMGEEVRELTASLGFERTQDLVGRSDLLVQARGTDRVDLDELIKPVEEMLDLEPLDLPVPPDEREAAGLVAQPPAARMRPKEPRAATASTAPRRRASSRGERIAGDGARGRPRTRSTELQLEEGSVGGQGLGAFNVDGRRHHRRGRRPGRRGQGDAAAARWR